MSKSKFKPSRPFDFTDAFFENILEEVIDNEKGYLAIRNSGGAYIVVIDGVFSMKFRGLTKQVYKTKEVTKEIFRTRLNRFMMFEHDGRVYHRSREGNKWFVKKREFNFD